MIFYEVPNDWKRKWKLRKVGKRNIYFSCIETCPFRVQLISALIFFLRRIIPETSASWKISSSDLSISDFLRIISTAFFALECTLESFFLCNPQISLLSCPYEFSALLNLFLYLSLQRIVPGNVSFGDFVFFFSFLPRHFDFFIQYSFGASSNSGNPRQKYFHQFSSLLHNCTRGRMSAFKSHTRILHFYL